jgi:hypothetical protein
MATPMTPAQFLAALRKWRVQVREYPDWQNRGRPQAWGPVYGVVVHHTGSDAQSEGYNDFLFDVGRSDLPAPLANVATEMDGDLWLGAAGRANHAGAGSMAVLNHVIREDYPGYSSEINPPADDGTIGNQFFYGNEVKYDGGQPMTSAQNRSAVLFAAAVCDFYGWSALSVIGHREWTRRKPDPGMCDMAAFRRAVRDQLAAGPPGSKPPEEDMPTAKEIVDALLATPIQVGAGQQKTVEVCLSEASYANDAFVATKNLAVQFASEDAQTDRIETAVNRPEDVKALATEIVAQLPPNADVQAAAEAAIRAVLGKLDEPATP